MNNIIIASIAFLASNTISENDNLKERIKNPSVSQHQNKSIRTKCNDTESSTNNPDTPDINNKSRDSKFCDIPGDSSTIRDHIDIEKRRFATTDTENSFTQPQTIKAPPGQNVHAVSIFGAGYRNSTASPLSIQNDIAGAPIGVVPNIFSSTRCHGHRLSPETSFNGCSGQYVYVADDSSVTPENRGVLYGINIDIAPKTERGTKSPSDDANALVIGNVGSAKGTESIYWGRNNKIKHDWGAVMGIDASSDFAIYSSGDYSWGWSMIHGKKSTFSKGVFLVPTPEAGFTPLLVLGNDYSNLDNNNISMQVDYLGNLIFPRSTKICKDVWASNSCTKFNDALVIETNDSTGIALTDGDAANAQAIHIDMQTGDLAFSRYRGVRFVRFDQGLRLNPTAVSSLPTCNHSIEGVLTAVNDASVAGYNLPLTGGGTYHVLGYCNGTQWTVH